MDFVNYKKLGARTAFIVSGGIFVIVGTIWTITNFELTGIGLAGLGVIVGTIINFSSKSLYKLFNLFKERQ